MLSEVEVQMEVEGSRAPIEEVWLLETVDVPVLVAKEELSVEGVDEMGQTDGRYLIGSNEVLAPPARHISASTPDVHRVAAARAATTALE